MVPPLNMWPERFLNFLQTPSKKKLHGEPRLCRQPVTVHTAFGKAGASREQLRCDAGIWGPPVPGWLAGLPVF